LNKFRNVANWVAGIILANLGICLSTKSNLGLSMIGASPYILHVWLRDRFPWFTQGTAEYFWEAVILIVACIIVRQFKLKYLLSFITAVIVGFAIDGWFLILGGNGAYETLPVRIAAFILGAVFTSCGIAFFFHSTMPLQVYELLVAEVSAKYNRDLNRVKYVNDIVLLAVALLLSLALTGKLTGIGVGTIVVTIINAPLIKFFRKVIDRFEKTEE